MKELKEKYYGNEWKCGRVKFDRHISFSWYCNDFIHQGHLNALLFFPRMTGLLAKSLIRLQTASSHFCNSRTSVSCSRPRKLSMNACWLSEWLKARIKGTVKTKHNGLVIAYLFLLGSRLWLCLPVCTQGENGGLGMGGPAADVSLSEEAYDIDYISRMVFSKHGPRASSSWLYQLFLLEIQSGPIPDILRHEIEILEVGPQSFFFFFSCTVL